MPSRSAPFSALLAAVALLAAACLPGCVSPQDQERQLARVAKDWCLVVRASQVIPVYPLTEDLQPGDVFLTQTPIGQEVRVYEDRGFLPLDNLLYRMSPPGEVYEEFYGTYYDTAMPGQPPGRRFPANRGKLYPSMPRAAFPTYSFQIARGGGLNLAIPVQGVPVGLNLLGSSSAAGTITLSDAYSYGLDIVQLDALLERWAGAKANADLLAEYGGIAGDAKRQPVYLRIVNRVYYTGAVNILLSDASSAGAAASAGAPKPVDLLTPDPRREDAFEVYQSRLSKLEALVANAAPGGTLRLAAASNRSVSLDEKFPRPLVIGYIAFDREIMPGGKLGPPVATLARISGNSPIGGILFHVAPDALSKRIDEWVNADAAQKPARIDRLRQWFNTHDGTGVDLTALVDTAEYRAPREQAVRDLAIP